MCYVQSSNGSVYFQMLDAIGHQHPIDRDARKDDRTNQFELGSFAFSGAHRRRPTAKKEPYRELILKWTGLEEKSCYFYKTYLWGGVG